MAVAVARLELPRLRSGPLEWLRSCAVITRWEIAGLRLFLPVLAVIEVLTGAGVVIGIGLLLHPPIPAQSVLYLSTGAPVITLYVVGLVFFPQVVNQQRMSHTLDFTQSLATPRSARFVAWYAMNLMTGIPGMIAALVAARLRFGIDLDITWWVIPATLLIGLTATSIGYTIGHAITLPMLGNILVQVLNFFAIGFAPLDFPPGQLPGWLVSLNHGLPFEQMGTVMRSAVGGSHVTGAGTAYLVLLAWSAAFLVVATLAVTRRS